MIPDEPFAAGARRAELQRAEAAIREAISASGGEVSSDSGTGETAVFQKVPAVGNRGMYYVDPQSGVVAWEALTCRNPLCRGRDPSGGPYLFTQPIARIRPGTDGKIANPTLDLEESQRQPCPACGRVESVAVYEPPEVASERAQLMQELRESQAVWRKALKRGGKPKSGERPPIEIERDLNYLRKLYLRVEKRGGA
jgi:hypothetical protein